MTTIDAIADKLGQEMMCHLDAAKRDKLAALAALIAQTSQPPSPYRKEGRVDWRLIEAVRAILKEAE